MRLLCLISNMGAGGAQRVMSRLAVHLAACHEVTLLTWEQPGTTSFYELPASVRLRQTDRLGGHGLRWLAKVTSRPMAVRREINRLQPHVVVSFMDMMNVVTLLGSAGFGVPVIVSERTDPWVGNDLLRRFLRDRAYRMADLIVVPTANVGRYFDPGLGSRVRIVGNPVPPAAQLAEPGRRGHDGRFRIVSVGRLSREKGHEALVRAFAHIAEQYPDWDVSIIGEGPERASLERMIKQLGLEDRITMPGLSHDIGSALSAAHMMAFPSQFEAFPNALAEGIAAGLPAVGYSGVNGVGDLIVDGKTGLLADRARGAAGLSEALERLMGESETRVRMGQAARCHAAKWAPERIFRLWDDVLAEAVARTDARLE